MTDSGKSWWGPVWRGLVVDKNGKHIQQMGKSLWLFIYLIIHADREEGFLDRCYETIMTDMGIKNKSTVRNWMDRLKKYKYIQTTRRPYSLYIEICNWRSIKKRMLDIEQSQEERVLIPEQESANSIAGECQIQVCVPKNKHSVNGGKQKGKGKRVLNNKQSKESIKESIKENIYKIFKFWNDQNITVHREIEKFKPYINARLKSYTPEEITQAIKNYKDILESPDHFFSYEWTLEEFLTRKNGLDKFMDREKAFRNYKDKSNGNGNGLEGNGADCEPSEAELREREERVKKGEEKFERNLGVKS